ncbi:unnamed protein product [Miscanthus lutarioriparius]|uniref:Reverse transcriptase zinc-binding domain-containing protein n=1 Tax=Miscanthus lutarioriparius TaxID=422564 RepID=A0A811QK30_9POAL|nr:unnamed protein product [Miscanthus lutarioriparius]
MDSTNWTRDIRRLTSTQKPFKTRDAYNMLALAPSLQDFHGQWIWGTKVPNKVKIFAWLYFKNRLNTKANLFDKNVMENSICGRCSHPLEDRRHVFFDCKLSKDVWLVLGLRFLPDATFGRMEGDCQQDPATFSTSNHLMATMGFKEQRHLPERKAASA